MDVNIAFACSAAMEGQHMKRMTAYTKEKVPKYIYNGKKSFKAPFNPSKACNQKFKMKFEATRKGMITHPARHPRQREEPEG
jgi:hypothetical protein